MIPNLYRGDPSTSVPFKFTYACRLLLLDPGNDLISDGNQLLSEVNELLSGENKIVSGGNVT